MGHFQAAFQQVVKAPRIRYSNTGYSLNLTKDEIHTYTMQTNCVQEMQKRILIRLQITIIIQISYIFEILEKNYFIHYF